MPFNCKEEPMPVTLSDLLLELELIVPRSLAESWDNVGLLIGNARREIRSCLLGLDPTLSLLEEAISLGADTLITHHPCIFRPLSFIHTETPAGRFLEKALAQKINVIACHTNFDTAASGVSDALAGLLGLTDTRALHPAASSDGSGLGRIGRYVEPVSIGTFMERVFAALGSDTVQIAGKVPESVQTVALCGGSGSDLAGDAFEMGADLYLSSEIKHSTARWAEDAGFCIIDGGHYGTEKPAMTLLKNRLEELTRIRDWDIKIYESSFEKPAFTFVTQNTFSI